MTVHNEPPGPALAAGPVSGKRMVALSAPSHEWIKEQAAAETARRGRTFTQPEVIERLIAHWLKSGAQWTDDTITGAELTTTQQRYRVWELAGQLGITDMAEIHAAAARLLQLPAGLTDLRELTAADADKLIGMLIAEVTQKRMGNQ